MTTKKPASIATSARGENHKSLIARYVGIAVAQLHELVVKGQDTNARKLEAEIEDQIKFASRADTVAALLATIRWVREHAENLASLDAEVIGIADLHRSFGETTEGGDASEHNK